MRVNIGEHFNLHDTRLKQKDEWKQNILNERFFLHNVVENQSFAIKIAIIKSLLVIIWDLY